MPRHLSQVKSNATFHTFSRLGAIASNSSMKIIDGEFFSASSKAFLKFDSDSPANLLIISGPLIRKKNAPVSFATARAIKVLPEKFTPKDYNMFQ